MVINNAKYNLLGIGNAIVDITIRVDDKFLDNKAIHKGSMALIDQENAISFSNLKYDKICSGGSVANSVVMASALGNVKCGFIGKVGSGRYADIFIKELGECDSSLVQRIDHDITGRSFILVTPDGQRTMQTYLGASIKLNDVDIDHKKIFSTNIIFIEGYLFDTKSIKTAVIKSLDIAKNYHIKSALTLSDAQCVFRHKKEFLDLINNGRVNILFANLEEIKALFGDNYQECLNILTAKHDLMAIITKSGDGCVGFFAGKDIECAATTVVDNPVDSTGAGDAFAAGFLHSYLTQKDFKVCLENGNAVAFQTINVIGARFDDVKKIKLK